MTNDIHRLGSGSVPSFQGTQRTLVTWLLSPKHKYHLIFQRNSLVPNSNPNLFIESPLVPIWTFGFGTSLGLGLGFGLGALDLGLGLDKKRF